MSKAIEDKNKIENVSKNLFEYCKESNKLIKDFGGQTIYAGGDDLLFFAPVLNKDKNKTIFELCEKISNIFNTKIPSATLSFGISINYVKFRLYEAVENSRELLFAKAKNDQRNNIAFNVTKHSGQSFETIINKSNKEVYDNFLVITSNIKGGEDMDNFLHSIHHKIDTYKTTINLIANNKEKLQNFFDNYFSIYYSGKKSFKRWQNIHQPRNDSYLSANGIIIFPFYHHILYWISHFVNKIQEYSGSLSKYLFWARSVRKWVQLWVPENKEVVFFY